MMRQAYRGFGKICAAIDDDPFRPHVDAPPWTLPRKIFIVEAVQIATALPPARSQSRSGVAGTRMSESISGRIPFRNAKLFVGNNRAGLADRQTERSGRNMKSVQHEVAELEAFLHYCALRWLTYRLRTGYIWLCLS
jgi:hypothetical protein